MNDPQVCRRQRTPAGDVAGACRRRAEAGGGGRSGGWLEGDGVAEGFEFGDEPAGLPFGVPAAGEVVGAKFVVGLSSSQDVPVR